VRPRPSAQALKITALRPSASADAAKAELMERFELSEVQAQAILDMQLRRLAARLQPATGRDAAVRALLRSVN
jgi:DNA gyrase subunit A